MNVFFIYNSLILEMIFLPFVLYSCHLKQSSQEKVDFRTKDRQEMVRGHRLERVKSQQQGRDIHNEVISRQFQKNKCINSQHGSYFYSDS